MFEEDFEYKPSFADYLPQQPWHGPPLPKLFNIYWPWYKWEYSIMTRSVISPVKLTV